ncbi:hypothetical protein PPYC1_17985 [Paenibacillus polymyxa]|nr:hypothetical protein PPYC1_17985 [Paenibacillus polymyxa]
MSIAFKLLWYKCIPRITKILYNPSNNIKKYELLSPKTSGSIRTIRIDEKLVKMLKRQEIKQKEIKLRKETYM